MDHEQLLSHWPAMVRVAHSVLGSRHDAEDCAAAAVAAVLEHPPEDVQNQEAFLVTMTMRRAMDVLRVKERDQRRDRRLSRVEPVTTADIAEGIVEQAEAVWVDTTARTLLQPRVYALLRLLADGTPMSQVARELGMTQRAAEGQLLRARKILRTALARALVALAALGVGSRRILSRVGPIAPVTLAGAFCIATATFPHVTAHAQVPRIAPGRGDERPATIADDTRLRIPNANVRATTLAKAYTTASGRGRHTQTTVTTLAGPAGSKTVITHGDTGGHEQGPVEVLLACVHDFTLNGSQVGCAG